MSTIDEQLAAIESSLAYLEQMRNNRFIIEKLYFENKFGEMGDQLALLMNGIAWLEYMVQVLDINMDADHKNRLFEGVREAIDVQDWISIVDFLTNPLVQYIELMNHNFKTKYDELREGKINNDSMV